jgi:hypothetical protein
MSAQQHQPTIRYSQDCHWRAWPVFQAPYRPMQPAGLGARFVFALLCQVKGSAVLECHRSKVAGG